MRSRAAAELLMGEGFRDVRSMAGGMRAWQGVKAVGPPEGGMAYFPEGSGPGVLAALAWALEDGSARFYSGLRGLFGGTDAAGLFGGLEKEEEGHKAVLAGIYRRVAGEAPGEGFPWSLLGEPREEVMEGGVLVPEALGWAEGRDAREVLEYVMSLEADSYDLYIRMERAVKDDGAKGLFRELSEEERVHLERVSALYEKGGPAR